MPSNTRRLALGRYAWEDRSLSARFQAEDLATITVLHEAAELAKCDLDVLITGESGVGKELLARGIHHLSQRANGPFVAINLAAIPESMVESELFGYEKGAFTGATERHCGRFEQADKGALFLDEIGHLPSRLQSKLLRALQDKAFHRLGGEKLIRANLRVLAATDKDLIELIKNGEFEKSLYFRFQITIKIPPLRERPADIPALVQHFLQVYNRKHSKNLITVSPEALSYLRRHPLPGNVRQLVNALEYAVVRADPMQQMLEIEGLKQQLADWETWQVAPVRDAKLNGIEDLTLDQILELVIRQRLKAYQGNKTKAAESLGISRWTLRAWCTKYRSEPEK